jgi:hypothetical protein
LAAVVAVELQGLAVMAQLLLAQVERPFKGVPQSLTVIR